VYDPIAGRWLSEDPLGYAAGDANLYRYVGNNPVNAADPSGLQSGNHTGLLAGKYYIYYVPDPDRTGRHFTAKFAVLRGVYTFFPKPRIELLDTIGTYDRVSGTITRYVQFKPYTLTEEQVKQVIITGAKHDTTPDWDYFFVLLSGTKGVTLWEETIRRGIRLGQATGFCAWAAVLQEFLNLKGRQDELTDFTGGTLSHPFVMPDECKEEIILHSKPMVEKILRTKFFYKKLAVGQEVKVPTTRVRWKSDWWVLWAGETLTQKEEWQLTDEHLFRAYGGASMTITGKVTGRAKFGEFLGLRYYPAWNVRATMTILDEADFAAGGAGGARYSGMFTGILVEIYKAGAALQNQGIHPKYWHTITFEADYKLPYFDYCSGFYD
jgi:hypothetical protein